ncbi:(2Fe-2S) ferredoxin domain-containing protein [bacterium]|nr:MAG: (2Fe-2S) ferredoxin domain-containing protein [bacterium]
MLKFPAPFPDAIFVCTFERPAGHPKPCCGKRGGPELRQQLKQMVEERGLMGQVRIFQSGCIGGCEQGPMAVRYPKGELMMGITPDDLGDILDSMADGADGQG